MNILSLRRSPFQELFDMRRDFDDLFNRFVSTWPEDGQRRTTTANMLTSVLTPPVNAYIDKDTKRFRCEIAMPGIDPDQIKVEVQGNTLSIRAERKVSSENKEANYIHSEMIYGALERDLMLPEGAETDKLNAEYRNGLLEITVPLASAALPRRVEVKGTRAAAKQIAA